MLLDLPLRIPGRFGVILAWLVELWTLNFRDGVFTKSDVEPVSQLQIV